MDCPPSQPRHGTPVIGDVEAARAELQSRGVEFKGDLA
ncbi:hypothetical protein BH20ACT18_BH20ACT18_10160 [soil metagenome]